MTESLKLTTDVRDSHAVIYTEGYINNQGGEEIARAAYKLMDDGHNRLLLNLAGTKIPPSPLRGRIEEGGDRPPPIEESSLGPLGQRPGRPPP